MHKRNTVTDTIKILSIIFSLSHTHTLYNTSSFGLNMRNHMVATAITTFFFMKVQCACVCTRARRGRRREVFVKS